MEDGLVEAKVTTPGNHPMLGLVRVWKSYLETKSSPRFELRLYLSHRRDMQKKKKLSVRIDSSHLSVKDEENKSNNG
ncbi:hypothetical protein YC2023_068612 [Brassica napus]